MYTLIIHHHQAQRTQTDHACRGETSQPDDHRSGQCSVVLIWQVKHFVVRFSSVQFYNVNEGLASASETQFSM